MRFLLVFLFVLLFFLSACSQRYIILDTNSGRVKINVEVSQTPDELQRGLMFRRSLDGGMLFVFPDSAPRSFWMKDTLIPLDMIFVDDGKIVTIHENVPPCKADPCSSYLGGPADYVVEVNAGFVKAHEIEVGDGFMLG